MQGFPFTFNPQMCEQCNGFCCRGESGYIFVTYQEIERIATFLQKDTENFLSQYVKKVGYRFSLIEKPLIVQDKQEWACYFFDEKKAQCSIYPVRPTQCQTFPFWERLKQSTLKEAKKECPYLESP